MKFPAKTRPIMLAAVSALAFSATFAPMIYDGGALYKGSVAHASPNSLFGWLQMQANKAKGLGDDGGIDDDSNDDSGDDDGDDSGDDSGDDDGADHDFGDDHGNDSDSDGGDRDSGGEGAEGAEGGEGGDD